jgi:hypothetical protein
MTVDLIGKKCRLLGKPKSYKSQLGSISWINQQRVAISGHPDERMKNQDESIQFLPDIDKQEPMKRSCRSWRKSLRFQWKSSHRCLFPTPRAGEVRFSSVPRFLLTRRFTKISKINQNMVCIRGIIAEEIDWNDCEGRQSNPIFTKGTKRTIKSDILSSFRSFRSRSSRISSDYVNFFR